MEAIGIIDQLLDVHGDRDAFGDARRFASSRLLQISARQILIASLTVAAFMDSTRLLRQYRSKRG